MTFQPKKLSHYFWDLRKDRLPLFRAIQSVRNLAVVFSGEHHEIDTCDDDDADDDNSETQIPIQRVPCKQEIQKVLDIDLSKILIYRKNGQELSSSVTIDTMIDVSMDRIQVAFSVGRAWFGDSIDIPATKDDSIKLFVLKLGWTPEYAILYKPRGVLCTLASSKNWDKAETPNLLEHLHRLRQSTPPHHRPGISSIRPLNHVGRLDLESEGLLLLTNDGTFQFGCTSPEVGLPKTYRVLVRTRPGRGKLGQVTRTKSCEESAVLAALHAELSTVSNEVNGIVCKSNEVKNVPRSLTSAESMTLVDFTCKDNLTQSHWSNHGESLKTSKSIVSRSSFISPPPVWYFLLDVILKEGSKRQVRRLFRSLEMTTLMLIRIELAGLSVSSVCPTKADSCSGRDYNEVVPETMKEAFLKCHDYSIGRKPDMIDGTFRYLTMREVDSIFSQINEKSTEQQQCMLDKHAK